MTIVTSILIQLLHVGLILTAAPTAAGIMDWLDARLSGRTGPPILQAWQDLLRLSRKTPLLIDSVSVVSHYAPAVSLGATLSAAALVPSFALGMALAPLADGLVVLGLLTIARVAIALAAFDSGSALPGIAQQRASALSVLAEPALMLAVITPALMGGSFNLDSIIGQQRDGVLLPATASTLAAGALLAASLGDLCTDDRYIDGMLGGMSLAITWMAGWIRRVIWINLIGGLFLPVGIAIADSGPIGWVLGLAVWAIKAGGFLLAVAAVRTMLSPMVRGTLADLSGLAVLLALLAIIVILASTAMA